MSLLTTAIKRKRFLQVATLLPAGAMVLNGCRELEDLADKLDGHGHQDDENTVDFGTGDIGVLNYAYSLEQLENAFYKKVTEHDAFNTIFKEKERKLIIEIKENELVHLQFYRALLGGMKIRDLDPNFETIDFSNKTSVLLHAALFEDTGIAAYNGSGKLFQDVEKLKVAGKIVSIEGRHAAILRNMLNPKSSAFAGNDVVDPMGLDRALSPATIIPMVQPFIKQTLKGSHLPNA